MSSEPLVSIIIPAYNSVHFLQEAIESCLAQTYPSFEIIVVDDGSTDETAALMQDHYVDHVQYIYQTNMGPSAARNKGVAAAKGEYIKFLDADDQLLPEHIQQCVTVLQQQPNCGVVYTRFQHVAEDGVTLLEMEDPPLLSGDVFCDLLLSNSKAVLTSALMVRASVLARTEGFREDPGFYNSEDWDLFLQLASLTSFASIDQILLRYRHHKEGLTQNPYNAAYGRLLAVKYARNYAGREQCLSDAEYDVFEADRHHQLAWVSWALNRRAEARRRFRKAQQLDSNHRLIRHVYIGMSFFFSAKAPDRLARIMKRIKGQSL